MKHFYRRVHSVSFYVFLISSIKQLWMNSIVFAEILYYDRSRSLHDAARAFVNINNVSYVDKTMIKGGRIS